ncbi:MAG: ribosome recycling factor [Bdellovibrionales bacterium]|nr:ribosome recycling factor [Bdellovibrionales bacterium]
MSATVQKTVEAEMKKSLEALSNELSKIRTGRANVQMLDAIRVDYYGNQSPISQVAAVSCPDARSFLISPWESSVLKDIEAAIVKSNLGMAPMNDGKVIRMRLPELTEERRKELVKHAKKIIEEARVSIRMKRRDANEELKKGLKEKTLSEDEFKKLSDSIQKVTDDFISKVDKVGEDKEKEIMTV